MDKHEVKLKTVEAHCLNRSIQVLCGINFFLLDLPLNMSCFNFQLDSEILRCNKGIWTECIGFNIKLRSDCLFAWFFRMAHAGGEDLYNSAVSQEEGVLLSCLFPSVFKISFAMFICVVTLLSMLAMLASLPGYRCRVLSGLRRSGGIRHGRHASVGV